MITLHDQQDVTDQALDTLGRGVLSDAISCTVVQEACIGTDIGIFELHLEYLLNGIHADLLQPERIIMAPAKPGGQMEPFRIEKVHPSVGGGTIAVDAQHVSRQLRYIICRAYPAGYDSTRAMTDALPGLAATSNLFVMYNHMADDVAYYESMIPRSMMDIIAGSEDSIVARSGCELNFSRYRVRFLDMNPNPRTFLTTANMSGFDSDTDLRQTLNAYFPYWEKKMSDGTRQYVEGSGPVSVDNGWAYDRCQPLNLSSAFKEKPSQPQLMDAAQNALEAAAVGALTTTKINFVKLWEETASANRIYLYDYVRILVPQLDLQANVQVVRTDYNVLADRYDNIIVGSPQRSLDRTIAQILRQNKYLIRQKGGKL